MDMKRLFLVLALSMISIFAFSQTLYLFGGENHDVFLGCINCGDYSSKSVWNEYCEYGSEYNSGSIWNEFGEYGSEFSSYSPWNPYATNPPVVVDDDGDFYGYFTVNEYRANRANFELALVMYKYYDLIRDDVSKWYSKIFE